MPEVIATEEERSDGVRQLSDGEEEKKVGRDVPSKPFNPFLDHYKPLN